MNRNNKVRRTARIIVSALALLVALGLIGLAGYVWACGTERWSVKTGTDPDAGIVDPSNPVWTSVSEMGDVRTSLKKVHSRPFIRSRNSNSPFFFG